jgi:hypothetical protein
VYDTRVKKILKVLLNNDTETWINKMLIDAAAACMLHRVSSRKLHEYYLFDQLVGKKQCFRLARNQRWLFNVQ